jgi:hypothetical protein
MVGWAGGIGGKVIISRTRQIWAVVRRNEFRKLTNDSGCTFHRAANAEVKISGIRQPETVSFARALMSAAAVEASCSSGKRSLNPERGVER